MESRTALSVTSVARLLTDLLEKEGTTEAYGYLDPIQERHWLSFMYSLVEAQQESMAARIPEKTGAFAEILAALGERAQKAWDVAEADTPTSDSRRLDAVRDITVLASCCNHMVQKHTLDGCRAHLNAEAGCPCERTTGLAQIQEKDEVVSENRAANQRAAERRKQQRTTQGRPNWTSQTVRTEPEIAAGSLLS